MQNMLQKMTQIIESSRGAMEPLHAIELLSFLGLLAKQDPDGFSAIVNTGSKHQYEAMRELGKKLATQLQLPEAVFCSPEAHRFDDKVLAELMSWLEQVTDFTAFARAIRELYCLGFTRSRSMESSNPSLISLYQALLGDCSQKTLFDGAAGMAAVTSALRPQHAILMEINHTTWLISYRLLLLEAQSMEFHRADALLVADIGKSSADVVILEPPLGIKLAADQRRELARVDYLQVPAGDAVSAMAADGLWLQLAMQKLTDQGTALLLMPQGWTFRPGYDAQVRQTLLESEYLEALISLPAGLISGTAIPSVLAILKKSRPQGAPVRLVDASGLGSHGRQGRTLNQDEAKLIADWVQGSETSEHCRMINLSELRAQEYNLSPSRYFEKEVQVEGLDIDKEMALLAEMQQRFDASQKQLTKLLNSFK